MNKIICNNINKYFHIKDDLLNVLSDINLQVNETDRVAISGISGAGKSTLLHIMAGLDIPNSGNILFNNSSNEISWKTLFFLIFLSPNNRVMTSAESPTFK